MFLYLIFVVILIVVFFAYMIYMPGISYEGELPAFDDIDYDTANKFEIHITTLCKNPAGRNFIEKQGLNEARKYIAEQFKSSGYQVVFQEYQLSGDVFANIEVTHSGTKHPEEIIIVGAHYDAVYGASGANDNGTGVAAILELANRFKDKNYPRTLRFVAFVNEEPPKFHDG